VEFWRNLVPVFCGLNPWYRALDYAQNGQLKAIMPWVELTHDEKAEADFFSFRNYLDFS
jgi:hypothetical protein